MRMGLVAVLLVVSSSAGAEDVLDGCKVTPIAGGVQFTCDGLIGSVSDFPNLAVKDALSSQLAGLKSSIKGELVTSDAKVTANGKSWSGVHFAVRRGAEEKPSFEGDLLGEEPVKGTARLALCGAATAKAGAAARCKKILPALFAMGPAAFSKPPADPMFAGKKVVIPEGCKTVDAGEKHFRIACGETAFVASLTLTSAAEMPKITAALKQELIKGVPGAVAGADRKCKIGGVDTICSTVTAGEGAEMATFVLGAALVNKVPTSVQCAQAALDKGVHPVCAGMLAL